MNILEITNTSVPYTEACQNFRDLYARQTEPFIIINYYAPSESISVKTRMVESLKTWWVLRKSKWAYIMIYVRQPHDTSIGFLSQWMKQLIPGQFEAYAVDSLEDARELAKSIIATRQHR